MNEDRIKGQWKQLNGKLKSRWGKFRGLPEVDGIVEQSLDAPARPDDSSSAGLSDDTASTESRELRVHVPSSVAYDYVHGRIETLAASTGVVVEWLDLEE